MIIDFEKLGAALREWQSWLTIATFAAIVYFTGRFEIALGSAAFVYSLLFRDWNLFSMDSGGPPIRRYADDDEAEAADAAEPEVRLPGSSRNPRRTSTGFGAATR